MGKSSVDAKIRIARRRAAKADGEPLSVAIVGTGIAGETAAYLLSRNTPQPSSLNPQAGWDLRRVYEARAAPGLHANSIELDGHHVDVPLRAVSPHYYANLFQLYQHLGVGMQPVDYSTSTSRFHPSGASSPVSTVPTFRYQNALVLGWALPFLVWSDVLSWTKVCAAFVIVRDFMFLVFTGPYLLREGMLEDIKGRVLRDAPKESSSSRFRSPTSSRNDDALTPSLTFGQLLRYLHYSSVFTDAFLYPMLSTLLSCSYAQVDSYPAQYILEFFSSRATTFFTGWFRVRCGVQEVSHKLLHQLRPGVLALNTPAKSVHYCPERDMVCVTEMCGNEEWYDVVILATEPSVAKKIWTQRTAGEDALMSSLEHYDANITVHTDPMLLPSERPQWRGMNVFRHESTKDNGPLAASMTSARLAHYHKDLSSSLSSATSPLALRRGSESATAFPAAGNAASTPAEGDHNTNGTIRRVVTTGSSSVPTSPLAPSSPLALPEIIETWNCFQPPAEGSVLHDIRMTRAVWSGSSKSVYDRWFQEVQGTRGVYLAGSYTEPGVTLLEQAVTSALRIGGDLGVPLPFPTKPCYEQSVIIVLVSSLLYLGWRCLRVIAAVLLTMSLTPLREVL